MNRRLIPHLACLAGLLVLVLLNAAAAKPASPGVEVKLFLDPSLTLDARNQPRRDVLAAFQATGNPVTIKMQFLDGPGLELHKAGWNIRFRTVQGKNEMELTYKRRYPVPSGLDAALAGAERDGFDDDEKDYEPELEWGYQQETLTFSNEKSKESTNPTLPSLANARTRAVNEMPGKLQRFRANGWAKGILSDANIYGPVEGRRWTGGLPDIDDAISIEVWTLPGTCGTGKERIVEVSFKKKERSDKAVAKREAFLQLLKQKGWLLPRDVLKTALILECVRGRTR
jgi:hypothetical protein